MSNEKFIDMGDGDMHNYARLPSVINEAPVSVDGGADVGPVRRSFLFMPFDFEKSRVENLKTGRKLHVCKSLLDIRESKYMTPVEKDSLRHAVDYISKLELRVSILEGRTPSPASDRPIYNEII